MRIATVQTHDIWYAKAVLPLFAHNDCKEITPIHGKWASYLFNKERLLQVKKSRTKGKRVLTWQFNFPPQEQEFLDGYKTVYLFLVCGNEICAITWHEAVKLMAYHGKGRQELLRVRHKKNGGYTVTGSNKDVYGSIDRSPLKGLLNYFFS